MLREKQMSDNSNRLDYETGLAMTLARSRLKENKVERNPKGTADEKLQYPYHHPKRVAHRVSRVSPFPKNPISINTRISVH